MLFTVTNKLIWLELRIHKGQSEGQVCRVDQGPITEKPDQYTKELQLSSTRSKECSGSVYAVMRASENVKMCKILFIYSVSGTQILQMEQLIPGETMLEAQVQEDIIGEVGRGMNSNPQKVTVGWELNNVAYFCNSHLFKVSIYCKSRVSVKRDK